MVFVPYIQISKSNLSWVAQWVVCESWICRAKPHVLLWKNLLLQLSCGISCIKRCGCGRFMLIKEKSRQIDKRLIWWGFFIYMLKKFLSCKIMELGKGVYILAMFLHSLHACIFWQWQSQDTRLNGYCGHFCVLTVLSSLVFYFLREEGAEKSHPHQTRSIIISTPQVRLHGLIGLWIFSRNVSCGASKGWR